MAYAKLSKLVSQIILKCWNCRNLRNLWNLRNCFDVSTSSSIIIYYSFDKCNKIWLSPWLRMTLQYPNYGIIMICGIAEHYGFGNPNIRNSVICNPQLIHNRITHHILRFTIITMYMYHKIIHYYIKKLYKLLSSFAYFFSNKI